MTRYALIQVAQELDVSVDDVQLVADVELGLDLYDPDALEVSERGKELLVVHFRGGQDPS